MKYLNQIKNTLNQNVFTAFILAAIVTLTFGVPGVEAAPKSGKNTSVASAEVVSVVSINKATAEELSEALVGVGLKKAEAIVSWRKQNGKFSSIEELAGVKGIGEKTIEKNKARIKL